MRGDDSPAQEGYAAPTNEEPRTENGEPQREALPRVAGRAPHGGKRMQARPKRGGRPSIQAKCLFRVFKQEHEPIITHRRRFKPIVPIKRGG